MQTKSDVSLTASLLANAPHTMFLCQNLGSSILHGNPVLDKRYLYFGFSGHDEKPAAMKTMAADSVMAPSRDLQEDKHTC